MDVTVVILTKEEQLHIARCLERLAPLGASRILVVDCFSNDGTQKIAKSFGAEVVEHAWPGNQAEQFNWALDNLAITSQWILRLDADEYLSAELIEELKSLLVDTASFNGIELPLARTWRGCLLRHEAGHVVIPRAFRRGKGRYDRREMDEKLVVEGTVICAQNCFIDDNLKSFDWWKAKHRAYAKKEARSEQQEVERLKGINPDHLTRAQQNKVRYRKLPLFIRAFIYAFYRYLAWDVWKDGWAGLNWTLWQGLWYRWIVDCEIVKLKRTAMEVKS